MESNLGTDKKSSDPNAKSEKIVHSFVSNRDKVRQTTSFLLDEVGELDDANNLMEEMLQNEELDETTHVESGLAPKAPRVFKLPSVNFTNPEKKVIVQYIENPLTECVLENLSSMREDFAKDNVDVNGFDVSDDAKDRYSEVYDVKLKDPFYLDHNTVIGSFVEEVVEPEELPIPNTNPAFLGEKCNLEEVVEPEELPTPNTNPVFLGEKCKLRKFKYFS